jgi:hypothetical protein
MLEATTNNGVIDAKSVPMCREQFHIPQPTPAYEDLMLVLPAVFVGTTDRLGPLVQLVCEEMSVAFEARSMTLPPWRQAKAMLSKWMPTKVPCPWDKLIIGCAASCAVSAALQGLVCFGSRCPLQWHHRWPLCEAVCYHSDCST